jgi:cyclin T
MFVQFFLAVPVENGFHFLPCLSCIPFQSVAPCCLFLSAKLEEQPRKLEHVIKVANICLQKNDQLDPKSEVSLP